LVLLAGDDYCAPHRLEQQVAEILNQGFGATLCIPQLVDENSRPLPDSRWPVFFKAFPTSSRELLSRLFFDGNFLCGTSVMLHRDLLERVRPWHCGLVQLHDFEKWIELTPICRFHRSDNRHTFYRIRGEGMNLSAHRNKWRSLIEKKIVYRDFFSTIPWDFIAASFHDHLPAGQVSQAQSIEQLTWPLYMAHKDPVVQMIGVEFMLESIRSEPGYARFRSATGGDVWSIYSQTPKIYRAAIAKEMRRLAGDVRTPLGRVRTMLRKTLAGARRRS
jgi:hypothetical protein